MVLELWNIIVGCILALLTIPAAVFLIETVAAMPRRKRGVSPPPEHAQRIAVLIPAHNEGLGILATLENVKRQLARHDRLLVVADNCSDETASIARGAGAEVIERCDPARRGKGYALAFGLRHLGDDPPEIVVVIDADCRLEDRVIDHLAQATDSTGQPVQALYLMTAPPEGQVDHAIAEFAWRVKNWIRPTGLRALGLPCQLMGTGMAFPWHVISRADLGHGHVVEDLKLGLELAAVGHAPIFCPAARVTSCFPASKVGAESQRARWEFGHFSIIRGLALPYLASSIIRRDPRLAALTLDMMVPPLMVFGAMLGSLTTLAFIPALFGFKAGFLIGLLGCAAFAVAVGLCLFKSGRDLLTLDTLRALAAYAALKARLYASRAARRQARVWVRAHRG